MSRKKSFTIMTWNIYLGADVTPLIGTMPNQVPEPDLIGLQEVALLIVKSLRITRMIDFLSILLQELKRLGLNYNVVAINKNTKIRLPSSRRNIIGLLDRDVILVRDKSPFLDSGPLIMPEL